jgi:quercetin dioxygenase-like cupin family protein
MCRPIYLSAYRGLAQSGKELTHVKVLRCNNDYFVNNNDLKFKIKKRYPPDKPDKFLKELIMKKADLTKTREFDEKHMKKFLIHDSPYFRIINFNLAAGIVFPVHSHDLEGQLSIQVIEGEGEFLGKDNTTMEAKTGDILISEIREPHGVRATTDMRIVVTIAPPI